MFTYIARRLILAAFTTVVISALAFFIMEVPPGDAASKYVDLLMGQGDEVALGQAEQIRKDLGLDKPVHLRYFWWVGNLVQGKYGRSFQYFCSSYPSQKPVSELINDRIWTTVALTGFTIIFT